jgi:IS5 family transposase
MASTYVTSVAADAPPIVAELQAVFDRLDDKPLLDALTGPVRRGPKGYPARTLWRCYVTKYVLGLPSTAALLRELRNNPYIARACGIESPDLIPHEATFSRFFARLSRGDTLPLLKDVFRSRVRECYATIPGFGKRVAMDSTTVKGWANGAKAHRTDPDGGWSVKTDSQGQKASVFGFKLHLMVDCETELPISAHVSAGNIHDYKRASNLLYAARKTYGKFHPQYLMADAGYTGLKLERLLDRQFGITPIIPTNAGHKHRHAKAAPIEASSGWKALFKQRTAVERVNSRLKGQHALNSIRVRRRAKVSAHCFLALVALQTVATARCDSTAPRLSQARCDTEKGIQTAFRGVLGSR